MSDLKVVKPLSDSEQDAYNSILGATFARSIVLGLDKIEDLATYVKTNFKGAEREAVIYYIKSSLKLERREDLISAFDQECDKLLGIKRNKRR